MCRGGLHWVDQDDDYDGNNGDNDDDNDDDKDEMICNWNCSMTQLCKNLLDDIFTILMVMKMLMVMKILMLMTITCYVLQAQLIRDQLII